MNAHDENRDMERTMKRSPRRLVLAVTMIGVLACSGTDTGTDAGTDAAADSGMTEWRIFVTDTPQNADFGGIAGADALCAAQAAAAGLDGEFKAWLSTVSSAVSDRITHASGPYVLVDGTMIANDWDDLVDGSILAPVNLDADGVRQSGEVWTGTLATGGSYPNDDCAAFTSASAGDALCGASSSTSMTWTENITPPCSTLLRLYCIEQ
jgi:hypothetical protein